MTPIEDEIVDTPEQAAALSLVPLLIREPLQRFLDEHGIGEGEIDAEPVGEGHSNVTYRIRRGDTSVVLRRPPRPPLPPSAHDVLREARVLKALGESDVPVPAVLATCSDESLLGVPFYVMEHLDGEVLTDATPPELATAECRCAIAELIVAALAALHTIDSTTGPLSDLGNPAGHRSHPRRRRRLDKRLGAHRRREAAPRFESARMG